MKITTEPTGERQVTLTIEVDEEHVKRAQRQTARDISREVDIPGFRKGRAPYEVIVRRLGEEVVRQELVNIVAADAYREALEQEDIIPYAPGELEDVAFDPLVLTFTVPLTPQVDLGDYREYRREFPEPEVTEEAMERALQGIQEQNAVINPVDRPAVERDVVAGSLVARARDGAVFLDEDEARVVLETDGDGLVPGLVEALVGVEAGDERTFTLALPDDFQAEELQGEEAEFEMTVEKVYERLLPDLDDDLARTVGKYDSFDELEEDVRNRLLERAEAQAEGEYAEQVLEDVIDQAEVAYPAAMVEESLDDAVENYEIQVERREHMMLKDYLRIQGKTMEELREELRPGVERMLRRSLVLGEIVEKEDLEVSDVELDIQIAESSERYGQQAEKVREALSAPEEQRDVRNRMLANKAVQRLVAIAKGEAPEVVTTEDEPAKAEEEAELEEEAADEA